MPLTLTTQLWVCPEHGVTPVVDDAGRCTLHEEPLQAERYVHTGEFDAALQGKRNAEAARQHWLDEYSDARTARTLAEDEAEQAREGQRRAEEQLRDMREQLDATVSQAEEMRQQPTDDRLVLELADTRIALACAERRAELASAEARSLSDDVRALSRQASQSERLLSRVAMFLAGLDMRSDIRADAVRDDQRRDLLVEVRRASR